MAEGHSLGEYLHLVAHMSEAQQGLLARCREHAMPPVASVGWSRHPVWLAIARDLADEMDQWAPETARAARARVGDANETWLEAQADALPDGRVASLDLACAPVIGAALQVYWHYLASQLQARDVARPEHANHCPVCGSHPVASVVRISLRYLHRALCGSGWHVVRAKCSNCDNTRDIADYMLEGGLGPLRPARTAAAI